MTKEETFVAIRNSGHSHDLLWPMHLPFRSIKSFYIKRFMVLKRYRKYQQQKDNSVEQICNDQNRISKW